MVGGTLMLKVQDSGDRTTYGSFLYICARFKRLFIPYQVSYRIEITSMGDLDKREVPPSALWTLSVVLGASQALHGPELRTPFTLRQHREE